MNYQTALVWFRRDLGAHDQAAPASALAAAHRDCCVFVFGCEILGALARHDRRVEFIWHSVRELDEALREHGGIEPV
jgi:deoxyribodipyrimidine photo-lyase